jgi:hypothetical protein
MSNLPVDLTALIELLQTLNQQDSRERQLSVMERRLVQAELDPCPLDFVDITEGVELLNSASLDTRHWLATATDLEPFFAL